MAVIQPRILVVDDEQMICELLSDELEDRGYRCDTALDGRSALEKIQEADYDIVLLDMNLPGISGREVLEEIRANGKHTEVIMVTAVNDVDTAVETLRMGAADYIAKPFSLDKINESINRILEKNNRQGEP